MTKFDTSAWFDDGTNLAKDREALEAYRALLKSAFTIQQAHDLIRKRQREQRAEQRENAPRVGFTLESLIAALNEKIGGPELTPAYAEHLVQPYCACENSYDGWETCDHWRDIQNESRDKTDA